MKLHRLIVAACVPALIAGCSANPGDGGEASEDQSPVELKATAGTYALDKTHASLLWSIPHMGLSDYTARFSKIDANVTLDPADLENSTVELTIDPLSVGTDFPLDLKEVRPDAGFDSWEDEIAKDEGKLAAADGAPITFKSTAVEQTGPSTANVTGDLTMRGQTKPVTMKATFNGDMESHPFMKVPAIGFNAEGTITPSEFGVNLLGGALGDEVTVRFSGEFLREADAAAAGNEGSGGEAVAE